MIEYCRDILYTLYSFGLIGTKQQSVCFVLIDEEEEEEETKLNRNDENE